MLKLSSRLTDYIIRNSKDPDYSLQQLEDAIDRLPIPDVDKDMYKAFHLDSGLTDAFMLGPESDEEDGGMGYRPEYINEMYTNMLALKTDSEIDPYVKRMVLNFLSSYSPLEEAKKPRVIRRDRDGVSTVAIAHINNLAGIFKKEVNNEG